MLADLEAVDAFAPEPNDQIFVVAGTGGGKSTLLATLTLDLPRLVAIDGKGSLTLPGAEVIELPQFGSQGFDSALERAFRWRNHGKMRVILRPHPLDTQNLACHDVIFAALYDQGPVFVWIDEISATGATASRCPPWLLALSARGRTRGIGIATCTQSAFAMTPLILRRNARFTLIGCSDAQDLAGIKREGIEAAAEIAPKSGTFLLYEQGVIPPKVLRFDIPPALKGWQAP